MNSLAHRVVWSNYPECKLFGNYQSSKSLAYVENYMKMCLKAESVEKLTILRWLTTCGIMKSAVMYGGLLLCHNVMVNTSRHK